MAMLRFLLRENCLPQSGVPEIGSQGVMSEILSGKRDLSIGQEAVGCAGLAPAIARIRVAGRWIGRKPFHLSLRLLVESGITKIQSCKFLFRPMLCYFRDVSAKIPRVNANWEKCTTTLQLIKCKWIFKLSQRALEMCITLCPKLRSPEGACLPASCSNVLPRLPCQATLLFASEMPICLGSAPPSK